MECLRRFFTEDEWEGYKSTFLEDDPSLSDQDLNELVVDVLLDELKNLPCFEPINSEQELNENLETIDNQKLIGLNLVHKFSLWVLYQAKLSFSRDRYFKLLEANNLKYKEVEDKLKYLRIKYGEGFRLPYWKGKIKSKSARKHRSILERYKA